MDPKAITRPAKGLDIRSLKDFKNLGSLKSIFCAKEISKPKILLGLLILLVFLPFNDLILRKWSVSYPNFIIRGPQ